MGRVPMKNRRAVISFMSVGGLSSFGLDMETNSAIFQLFNCIEQISRLGQCGWESRCGLR